ncbi:MAG: polysaccharide export protein, partial [Hyphomicrobium sp.]|nr:polysaccharide export protein [Hyphomicrobium sp.]
MTMRRAFMRIAFGVTLLFTGGMATPLCAADYALDTGDKLHIAVHDWPDLTGEFNVTATGTIFLPMIGEIPVKGFTASQVATKIATELQQRQKLNDLPSATTEIIQFRPFYVLGDVQSPGSFPFQPGLTVMQAVSVAGGYYRLVDVASPVAGDASQLGEREDRVGRLASRGEGPIEEGKEPALGDFARDRGIRRPVEQDPGAEPAPLLASGFGKVHHL